MSQDNEILKALRDPQPVRKTQIIIETHTTTVIRTTGDVLDTAFCNACGLHTADLPAANAAAILQVDQSELDLFRQSGELHNTERGGLCGKSLIDHSKREIASHST